MVLDIHQGEICGGDDPACRMTVHMAKGLYLFQKDIFQSGPFPEYPVRSSIQIFIRPQQVAQQGPFTPEFWEIALDEQYLKQVLLIAEDHTVDRYGELKFRPELHRSGIDIRYSPRRSHAGKSI
jgi:hypothetical protein